MGDLPREVFEKFASEYQTKITETSRQLAMVRGQLQGREREKRASELTAKELSTLDDSVLAYRSVGRMFIQEDVSLLKAELDNKASSAAKEIVALERAAGKLDAELKDTEKSLQGLIKRAIGQ
ncbi:hypothetical protein HK105_206921 [Polyrhizophydium stewartii]|uniref:Prefoldin subunit 1 n=1 Tax=Polyrhizophydium stewartii TaxID=2732419 RepID=A0ABR4N297_9FUNG|nr:hypothetical protein HK105_000849 [Polyrhizophydium stewartii]